MVCLLWICGYRAGMDGASCVLRAVCEVGAAPLDEYGLLGELITLVFAYVGYLLLFHCYHQDQHMQGPPD